MFIYGLAETLFSFLGMAVGIGINNFEYLTYWVNFDAAKGHVILIFGISLLLFNKIFRKTSSKIIVNVWVGAYSTYIAIPITKYLAKAPMSSDEKQQLREEEKRTSVIGNGPPQTTIASKKSIC